MNPIHTAMLTGDREVLRLAIEQYRGNSVDYHPGDIDWVFREACGRREYENAMFLFDAEVGVIDLSWPLTETVHRGDDSGVRLILERMRPRDDASFALHSIIIQEHFDEARFNVILDACKKCRKLEHIHDAFKSAARWGHPEAVKLILADFPVVRLSMDYAMRLAALNYDIEMMKLLIDCGANNIHDAFRVVSCSGHEGDHTRLLDALAYLITLGIEDWAPYYNSRRWTPNWTWRLWKTQTVEMNTFKQNDPQMRVWIHQYEKLVSDSKVRLTQTTTLPTDLINCIVDFI